MVEIKNEAAAQVYGDSWGSFLEKATESANEQPVVESDTDTDDEPEIESEDVDTDDYESDDEQPEGDSDEEESDVDADPEISLGEGKNAVKLSELKSGYMRQADYTRKTNELAAQRTELEGQRESLKDAQGFKDHMEANPWIWEQVNRALQEFESTGDLPLDEVLQDAQYGRQLNYYMAENARLARELQGISSEFEGVKLSSSIQSLKSDLKADYGDLVTDDYMNTLQERAKSEKLSMDTLKEIAEGHLAKQSLGKNKKDIRAVSKKAEAEALQRLAETKRTAPKTAAQTGARPSKPAVSTGRKESWADILNRTFNQ